MFCSYLKETGAEDPTIKKPKLEITTTLDSKANSTTSESPKTTETTPTSVSSKAEPKFLETTSNDTKSTEKIEPKEPAVLLK